MRRNDHFINELPLNFNPAIYYNISSYIVANKEGQISITSGGKRALQKRIKTLNMCYIDFRRVFHPTEEFYYDRGFWQFMVGINFSSLLTKMKNAENDTEKKVYRGL